MLPDHRIRHHDAVGNDRAGANTAAVTDYAVSNICLVGNAAVFTDEAAASEIDAAIGADVSDIAPIGFCLKGCNIVAQVGDFRKNIFRKIASAFIGAKFHKLACDNVNAGIYDIAYGFAPDGLFNEARDHIFLVGKHHAELCRNIDGFYCDCSHFSLLFMKIDHFTEIYIRDRIAADHQKILFRIIIAFGDAVFDAAGRTERRRFRTEPNVCFDFTAGNGAFYNFFELSGQVFQSDCDIVYAVLLEQSDNMKDHRLVFYRNGRLWHPACDRPKSRSFAAGHNNSFHLKEHFLSIKEYCSKK